MDNFCIDFYDKDKIVRGKSVVEKFKYENILNLFESQCEKLANNLHMQTKS